MPTPKEKHGQDPFKAGLGPSQGGRKVDVEYVRCVRQAHEQGKTLPELMELFPKLKSAAIRSIVRRESWRNVR